MKCDKKIDDLNYRADDAIRRFHHKSPEALKFNEYKEDLKGKGAQARDIDKRKHKEYSDQQKMRDRLAKKPGLELLVRLADDVKEGKVDCEGVDRDADILYKSLQDLEAKMDKDGRIGKRNKLDDLRKLLFEA